MSVELPCPHRSPLRPALFVSGGSQRNKTTNCQSSRQARLRWSHQWTNMISCQGYLSDSESMGPAKNVPTSFSKRSFFLATDMVLQLQTLPLSFNPASQHGCYLWPKPLLELGQIECPNCISPGCLRFVRSNRARAFLSCRHHVRNTHRVCCHVACKVCLYHVSATTTVRSPLVLGIDACESSIASVGVWIGDSEVRECFSLPRKSTVTFQP